ncbi:hypothetical protein ACFYYD_06880 [Streptomyces bluensis]|uniref:hypothetical protein n=1 Tax=Streptomyces bluensis TaxID=33897 RepID=UPI003690819E
MSEPSELRDLREPLSHQTTPPATAASRKALARRGGADPVKALMHRHRALCERAVDPLEIAAGLEARGVTDRTAARFRHRDVFSLAEEMYARVPREQETRATENAMPDVPDVPDVPGAPDASGAPDATGAPDAHAGWAARAGSAALALLPGAVCTAVVVGVRLTDGRPRLVIGTVGALTVFLSLRLALRRGPLRTASDTTSGTHAWTWWLLAYAVLGDGLLNAGLDGGPHGPWSPATASALALAVAYAPAVWCAHLLAVRARRTLAVSRGLADFADSVRPVLLTVPTLFLCALVALLALCGAALDEPAAYAATGSLGTLLLLARLLTAHGFTRAPALALGAAGAIEVIALATVFASRLPGCSFLAAPVGSVVDASGPGAVPGLACGLAALALLIHSTRTLTRASAHAAPAGAP